MLRQILANQQSMLQVLERLSTNPFFFPPNFPLPQFPPLPPFEQPYPHLLTSDTPTTVVQTTISTAEPATVQTMTAEPLASTVPVPTPSLPQKLKSADEVVKRYPKLRGDSKMGKLAVALARECYFGTAIMTTSSVGGKGPGTQQLPDEGMNEIHKVIFFLCPAYHNQEAAFEEMIWQKCKTAINHACLKYRNKK